MSRNRGAQKEAGPVAESATFDELFERYQKKIFNLVYRLVGDFEEAADLTSDTFAQAWKSFGKFRGDSHPYTWLYRIAVNRCKNYFRQKDRRAQFLGRSLDAEPGEEGPEPEVADWQSSPATQVESQELQRLLNVCISSLPLKYRLVMILRDLQDLSYQEIAEVTDSSLEAVKSRLFRARAMLRKKLAPYLSSEL